MACDVIIFSDVNGVAGFGRYGGPYRVATELRDAGYSTQVVEFLADLTLGDIERIFDKYLSSQTLFVGFATTLLVGKVAGGKSVDRMTRTAINRNSGHLPQDDDFVQEVFSAIRKRNPHTKIVIGGGKASNTSLPGVDYWVWGYADRSAVALANCLRNGGSLTTQPARFGQVITHRDYPYDGYPRARIEWTPSDFVRNGEHLPIEIDRGCIFRCAFCAHPLFKKKGEFSKSRDVLRDEFIRNHDNFGTTGYMFCDDTINDTLAKVESLHEVITGLPFEIEWTGFGRVDVVYSAPEQRELLLETGLRGMLVGIESFHINAAKTVGKGLHPDKTKDSLYYLKEKWKGRVSITASFIIGLPGEPEDSIWKTVEWLQRDDCPVDEAIFSPLNLRAPTDDPDSPMSRLALTPEQFGYELAARPPGRGVSTDGPQWRNQFFDKAKAEKLALQIQEIFRERQPVGNWAVYSRLRTLGFSHQEIVQKGKENEHTVLEEADKRRAQFREEYLDALLA
jgi:radical SAM superfamily enzyme YgiQ (UPF0313 family)